MDSIEFWLILFQIYFHAAICCIHYNLHNIITKNTAFILSAFLVPLVPLVCLLKGRGNDHFPFTSSIPLIILSASTKCFFKFSRLRSTTLIRFKNIYIHIYRHLTFQNFGYSYCSFLCLFYFYCIFFQFEWAVLHTAVKMQRCRERCREISASVLLRYAAMA